MARIPRVHLLVEAMRRETRLELVELFRQAVKHARGRLSGAEAGVIAVALVSLLETAAASTLNEDAAAQGLGPRRFGAEVRALADRIAGVGAAVSTPG